MAPRLSGQNRKFFRVLLSPNSQKRLEYKESNTKHRSLSRKPRTDRILIYRRWPIGRDLFVFDAWVLSWTTDESATVVGGFPAFTDSIHVRHDHYKRTSWKLSSSSSSHNVTANHIYSNQHNSFLVVWQDSPE